MNTIKQASDSILSNNNKSKPSVNDGSKVIKQIDPLNQSNLAQNPNANTDKNYSKQVFSLSLK